MGFAEQLQEILLKLPENRQTLLFSATLPKLLVDFASAGLQDPTLVRLDTDTKLSDKLQTQYLLCRRQDKTGALVNLLQEVVGLDKMTVIFVSTKHHAEYISNLLLAAGIQCTFVYGSLDQTARKINVAKFRRGKIKLLVVTDVAARGIDIPMLDVVINYDFPPKPKLFVHRVGRVARAGRSGIAYSLLSKDELPYVLDLHLFLGRGVKYAEQGMAKDVDGIVGSFPQGLLTDEIESVAAIHQRNVEVSSLKDVADNAYKLYDRSRPLASKQSVARGKAVSKSDIVVHPVLQSRISKADYTREDFLQRVSSYKSSQTVFEINKHGNDKVLAMMSDKRRHDQMKISRTSKVLKLAKNANDSLRPASARLEQGSETDILGCFKNVIAPGRNKGAIGGPGKKLGDPAAGAKAKVGGSVVVQTSVDTKEEEEAADAGFFIPYRSGEGAAEEFLAVENPSFQRAAAAVSLNLQGDDSKSIDHGRSMEKWDRRKKKFVKVGGGADNKRIITTENGTRLPASYRSDRYADWVEKHHANR